MDTLVSSEKAKTKRPSRWLSLLKTLGFLAVVGIVLAGIAYELGWVKWGAHAEAPVEVKKVAAVSITTGTVGTRSVKRVVDAVGTIHGYEEVVISSNVAGRVQRLMVDVASRVEPGALLAQIDPTNYELNLRSAEGALNVELARLGLQGFPAADFSIENLPMIREAQSRLTYARNAAERNRQLALSNAVSAQDLESATADLQAAEAAYENQVLQVRSTLQVISLRDEAVKLARQQLQDTRIIAPKPLQPVPFATRKEVYAVIARDVSEGTYVRVGDEVFRLVIDDALRLRVSVPERFLWQVETEQAVEVSTAASPDSFAGVVSRINPAINEATRTFEVEVLLDNSNHQLKPGGFATAQIITKREDTATTVPMDSIVTFAGVTKLFLVDQDRAREVQVVLGEQGGDWVEIVSPELTAGATVVTSGQTALYDGAPVTVRQTMSDSVEDAPLHEKTEESLDPVSASPASGFKSSEVQQ